MGNATIAVLRTGKNLRDSFAINSDYRRSLLEGLELFKGVSPNDVHALLTKCDRRDLAKGELLLSPGAKNEHVFIVLAGSVNVHVGSPDAPVLATMEVGACVGEMSIIDERVPSAQVMASEPTVVLEIEQEILWRLVSVSHEIARNLLYIMSERVRYSNLVIADSLEMQRKYQRYATIDALTDGAWTGTYTRPDLDGTTDYPPRLPMPGTLRGDRPPGG